MRRVGFVLLALSGCQAAQPPQRREAATHRWVLVERTYDEAEHWVQDAGDADLAAGETTLVFESVEMESRCLHRLRLSGEVLKRQQVGDPVELTLSIVCDPGDVHRVDLIPSRPGVRIIAIRGATDELPDLAGFCVRGSANVAVRFTADSRGPGGIKAVLSEVVSSK